MLDIHAVVLDCPDAQVLARFYASFLGWDLWRDEGDWAQVRRPGGGTMLSFQTEAGYVPPVWPAAPGRAQMQSHLDIKVGDLAGESTRAVALGATLATVQPEPRGLLVHLDPAGHPFCLFLDGY